MHVQTDTHHAVAHAEALVDRVDGGDDGLVLPVFAEVKDGAELALQPVPEAVRKVGRGRRWGG